MNPTLIQAAKQRVDANAAAFVNEFKRFSVPAMAEAEENGVTRITIAGDANQNSHDDDALSHERLSDMVKAMNLIRSKFPGVQISLGYNSNAGSYEVEVIASGS